jgi:hypothetical protein
MALMHSLKGVWVDKDLHLYLIEAQSRFVDFWILKPEMFVQSSIISRKFGANLHYLNRSVQ